MALMRQPVVSPPAAHIPCPPVPQFPAAQTLTAPPEFSHPFLEPFQTFRSHLDLSLRVDPKPQKLSFPRPPRAALARVDLQFQVLADPFGHTCHHPLRRAFAAHVNVAVVRIAAEVQPAPLQFLVQGIQIDVRQERRERSPLRGSLLVADDHPLHHDSRPQVAPDQPQHPFVPDCLSNPVHQDVVVHPVEELGDVQVHHPALPCQNIPLGRAHRVVGTPPRAESVAARAELQVKDRLQHLQKHLLYPPVLHRRYPEQAGSPLGLGYFHPPHRTWDVCPAFQFAADALPVLADMVAQLCHGHPVDPRRARVAFHSTPCRRGILRPDHLLHQFLVHRFL